MGKINTHYVLKKRAQTVYCIGVNGVGVMVGNLSNILIARAVGYIKVPWRNGRNHYLLRDRSRHDSYDATQRCYLRVPLLV